MVRAKSYLDLDVLTAARQRIRQQCSESDCSSDAIVRGMCNLHYQRWRRRLGQSAPVRASVEDRFWEKVDKNANEGHWMWMGSTFESGYGKFQRYRGAPSELAHRVAWEFSGASLKEFLHVHHRCEAKACVNPRHLRLRTPPAHALEPGHVAWVQLAKTHCPQGHPYDEFNTYITPEGWRQCRICRKVRRG